MAAALLGDDAVRRKVRTQPLDNEAFGSAVGFGDQVEVALQLERDTSFEVRGQKRAGFARDVHRGFQVGSQLGYEPSSTRYLISCLKINRFGWPFRVIRMNEAS